MEGCIMKSLNRSLFILLCIVCAPAAVFAAVPQAILKNIQGKVEIKTLNASAWVPATEGMILKTMTTISTGFDSSVTLEMGGNTIFVKPLTRMTLDQLLEQQGTVKTSCYLRVGGVKASVKSAEGVKQDFKVQSPYSTASVRGTVFEYDGLKLNVIEGLVSLKAGRPARTIQLPTPDTEDDVEGETEAIEPDLSADFIGSPEQGDMDSQEVFVPAGNTAELKIQRGGSMSAAFSGDESEKKKTASVATTDSAVAASGSVQKANAGTKYGTVIITVTAPEK